MSSTTAPATHSELSYVERAKQDTKESEGTGPAHPSLAICARHGTPNNDDLRIGSLLDERVDLAVSSGLSEVAENAVEYGNFRDDYTKRVVAALLNRREFDTARNIASCGNEFERGTTTTCANSRLCSECRRHPGGNAQRKYADKAVEWPRHTFMALTMPEPFDDPVRGREAFLDAFKSLKDRKLSLTEGWLAELGDRDDEFAEKLRRDYFDEGRSVPFLTITSRHSSKPGFAACTSNSRARSSAFTETCSETLADLTMTCSGTNGATVAVERWLFRGSTPRVRTTKRRLYARLWPIARTNNGISPMSATGWITHSKSLGTPTTSSGCSS